MAITVCQVSISVDGYIAGPNQSLDDPIGAGGTRLHRWHWDTSEPGHEIDAEVERQLLRTCGACVMGRNMYGPIRGEWEGDWRGWWGEDPPYHSPVFVLTHYPHEPIEMAGGTTFHFVTDGFDAAFARAKSVAGDEDIRITGGASTVRQALAAGVIDELTLDVIPLMLGGGERLLDGVEDPGLQPVEVVASPFATHIRYRVGT